MQTVPSSFIILAFICLSIHSTSIYFDGSKEQYCLAQNGGCNFNNASIWINSTIPSTNDSVSIAGTGTYSSPLLVVFPEGYDIEVISLELQSANVETNNQSVLSLTYLQLGINSFFTIKEGSSLRGITVLSNLTLSSAAHLRVYGNMNWMGDLLLSGEITLSPSAAVLWGNTTYASTNSSFGAIVNSNYLTILPYFENVLFPSGLIVNQELAIVSNSSATVNEEFILGDIDQFSEGKLILASNTTLALRNVSAFIVSTNGTFGTGNITITDSKVNIHNQGLPVFNGSVFVSGVSKVQFQQFSIRNLHLGSSSDSVSIIGLGLAVGGADGYGSINVEGAGLNISGKFSINGPIEASNSRIVVTSSGTLVLAPENALGFENSTILLGGNIRGDLEIPQNSVLNTTYDNSTIFGNVINSGIMHVAENRILLVYGNFTQMSSGTLRVDLVNTNMSAINVTNATVSIDGALQYRLTKKPFLHSAKFPILSAINSNLSGNFINNTATALETSLIRRDLKLDTEYNIIYIVYDFSVKDVEAWEWVVIAVVGGLIIAIAFTCIFKFRANRNYEEIK